MKISQFILKFILFIFDKPQNQIISQRIKRYISQENYFFRLQRSLHKKLKKTKRNFFPFYSPLNVLLIVVIFLLFLDPASMGAYKNSKMAC